MPHKSRRPSPRWLGVPLAVAALVLALLSPAAPAVPALEPPEPPIAALAAQGTVPINALDAAALAGALPGIGPSYAERIVMYRRLFGPIADAETLRELGIPAPTVERIVPLIRFGS